MGAKKALEEICASCNATGKNSGPRQYEKGSYCCHCSERVLKGRHIALVRGDGE